MAESPMHYAVLGVPARSSAEQIAARYKALLAEAKGKLASGKVRLGLAHPGTASNFAPGVGLT